ncbi:MAG TPA: CHAP domain-containing protein [Acidimicrobiales bacterium]|jgi:hypothetical protein|nr:CHAP domain-containing protein [Acidimicrobiales bacterium]
MTRRVRIWSVAVLALASMLWAAPAQATTSRMPVTPAPSLAMPTVAAVTGHLLDISATTKPISPWASTDLSALESAASVLGAVSTATTSTGAVVVAGRTTDDHVELFTSANGRSWNAGDLTVLARAPRAMGSPSVVFSGGVVRVFFRTAAGDLEEMENDRKTADPWFASSLTALTAPTDGALLSGDPSAVAPVGYPIAVYARATTGDLVSFTLTSTRAHPWYYVDVTALSRGPQIAGTPVAVPAPDGFGLTAVFALNTAGHLIEFTNDDVGYHLWSARDVSTALGLPSVSSSPTVLAGLPTEVAIVTTTGHLLVATIPSVSLVSATFSDLSALVRQKVAPGRIASIAPSQSGYVVAGVTSTSHVVVFSVPSPSTIPQHAPLMITGVAPPAAPSVTDVTMQPLTEQFARSDPAAIEVHGVVNLFVASGGFLGLIPRIVLTAESQDQHHARIEDTPAGSDCNPFTASFGRGSRSGCAPGTASEEWCSDFAQWVWETSGINTSGISGASKTFVTWGRSHGRFLQGINQKPAVGDAVVWGVLNPLWGAHVGIVVGVKGKQIDVVSGNSGPLSVASAVWNSGYFLPSSQSAQGDPIIGYTSPVALPGSARQTPSSWPRTGAWPVVQGSGSVTVAG